MDKFMAVVLIIALAIGLCLLGAFPTMWIVNYLFTPELLLKVFGIAQLTFWKAFWLDILVWGWFKNTTSSSKE